MPRKTSSKKRSPTKRRSKRTQRSAHKRRSNRKQNSFSKKRSSYKKKSISRKRKSSHKRSSKGMKGGSLLGNLLSTASNTNKILGSLNTGDLTDFKKKILQYAADSDASILSLKERIARLERKVFNS